MKNLFSILCVLFCFSNLTSQDAATDSRIQLMQQGNIFANESDQMHMRMMEYDRSNEENNYMLFPKWTKMTATGQNGEALQVDSCNYHIKEDKMYFARNGGLFFLYPEMIQNVEMEDRKFEYFRIKAKGKKDKKKKSGYAFMEVMSDGKLALLKKYEVKKKTKNSNPMGLGDKVVEYRKKHELYYAYREDNVAYKVPKNKKKFLRIFKDKRKAILELARSEDMSLKSYEDIFGLFEFYNALNSI